MEGSRGNSLGRALGGSEKSAAWTGWKTVGNILWRAPLGRERACSVDGQEIEEIAIGESGHAAWTDRKQLGGRMQRGRTGD